MPEAEGYSKDKKEIRDGKVVPPQPADYHEQTSASPTVGPVDHPVGSPLPAEYPAFDGAPVPTNAGQMFNNENKYGPGNKLGSDQEGDRMKEVPGGL